jgi:hypothetical protein
MNADTCKAALPSTTNWDNVAALLQKHYHEPDVEAARAVYSTVAAHRLNGPPVWPMVVAPPGSLKTELLNALVGLSGVHLIDSVTPQTFISGQLDEPGKVKQTSPSLLHRIGVEGIIVYPDFSTVLAMNADKKAAVLADMRRIYDGKLHKEFGTGENAKQHEWEGRITFLVAVTGDIDRHYSVFNTLGERFVMIRWPRAGGINAALIAMNQDRKEVTEQLRAAVHDLFDSLPDLDPTLPVEFQIRIAALSEIAVRARTHIPRNGYTKDIIYVPEPESNTRLAQQLAQLAKGSALLDGRSEVNEADFALVRRVAFDCMPPTKRAILEAAIFGKDLESVKLPASTRKYATDDLEAVGLLLERRLSPLALEMLETARLIATQSEEKAA